MEPILIYKKNFKGEPHAPHTRFTDKDTGRTGTIKEKCLCTSPLLHYEVYFDDDEGRVQCLNHVDIVLFQ